VYVVRKQKKGLTQEREREMSGRRPATADLVDANLSPATDDVDGDTEDEGDAGECYFALTPAKWKSRETDVTLVPVWPAPSDIVNFKRSVTIVMNHYFQLTLGIVDIMVYPILGERYVEESGNTRGPTMVIVGPVSGIDFARARENIAFGTGVEIDGISFRVSEYHQRERHQEHNNQEPGRGGQHTAKRRETGFGEHDFCTRHVRARGIGGSGVRGRSRML